MTTGVELPRREAESEVSPADWAGSARAGGKEKVNAGAGGGSGASAAPAADPLLAQPLLAPTISRRESAGADAGTHCSPSSFPPAGSSGELASSLGCGAEYECSS